MTGIPIEIIDKSTGEPVPALLMDGLDALSLLEVEEVWGRARRDALKRIPPHRWPEHYHWNWAEKARKLDFLAYRCIGIQYQTECQGLMMLMTAGNRARLMPDAGKELAYIDYIESAPWNLAALAESPRFGGIGIRLVEAAVRASMEEGFHGRIGLHSLPQAENLYHGLGMVNLGTDEEYQGLSYFEFDRVRARAFLGEE